MYAHHPCLPQTTTRCAGGPDAAGTAGLPLDLVGAVITTPPLTNANQLTRVVELLPATPRPNTSETVTFEVMAFRATPDQPVLDGVPVTQEVTLPRSRGLTTLRFPFPPIIDDGQWAFMCWVDSRQQVSERSEANFCYAFGPAWR
jgi:hypothetical protein